MSAAAMFSLPLDAGTDYREYRNAWGGAFRIWDAIAKRWLAIGSGGLMSSLAGNDDRLWRLCEDQRLPLHDRAALVLTFDRAYTEAQDVPTVARLLREFDAAHPVEEGVANHLPQWADDMEAMVEEGAEAIAFHHTSVSENPWVEWPEVCRHNPDPEPIHLTTEDGKSLVEWLPEIRPPDSENKPEPQPTDPTEREER